MTTVPRIDSYEWAGGREAMLRFGPDDGPAIVLALPLFEEANRTRAFGVSLLRALAARGIGGVLPELPGQGESEVPTAAMGLVGLRAAFAAVAGSQAVGIRSGALLVDARSCWLLAPQHGSSLVRELARVEGGRLGGEIVEVAGNLLSRHMLEELAAASHPGEGRGPVAMCNDGGPASPGTSQLGPGLRRGSDRVVRLATDPRPADLHVVGSPPWRRAEPGNDPGLVEILAADIADWIATCAA